MPREKSDVWWRMRVARDAHFFRSEHHERDAESEEPADDDRADSGGGCSTCVTGLVGCDCDIEGKGESARSVIHIQICTKRTQLDIHFT